LSKSYDRCVVGYGYGRSSTNTQISILILKSTTKLGGHLTPPEPEVESSPVSAKGSNLFRFWIAELAVYTQLVLIFKNAKYSKKDASSSTHERERERGWVNNR